MQVSLHLPVKTTREVDVLYHPRAKSTGEKVVVVKFRATVPIAGLMYDIKKAAQTIFGIDPAQLYAREVFHCKYVSP
jgi:hypothetical protein